MRPVQRHAPETPASREATWQPWSAVCARQTVAHDLLLGLAFLRDLVHAVAGRLDGPVIGGDEGAGDPPVWPYPGLNLM
jgi:hypothetical protein